ncbi:polycomb complex protein BMI-1-like [Paramacrobiotus metropolitanus]|uniref:polycomb complex protein BMI-1-like n=1 Tax=Paramacrobiotus metropolitanus TaxID=2943436 RepID=UPI0024461F45|nr:polycomb complex protein BMI-1-like [Paramacrobiotus metropolitanus]XP_055347412.1 polycomb complex protein BMI-1-like [Paramacrobiotus metropolitanus]
MDSILNIPMADLSPLLICQICRGFLVDATSLPECGHVFCKTCIVMHCNKSTMCPLDSCRVYIHARPLTRLKKDTTLQTVVYKLLPEIYHSEMSRRRLYFKNNAHTLDDVNTHQLDSEARGLADNPAWLPHVSIPDEIEVELEYKFSLISHLRASFSQSLLNKEQKADSRTLRTMCHCSVSVQELRQFIVDLIRIPADVSIIIMQGNVVMTDAQTVADVWRFDCGKPENQTSIKLHYIFLPASSIPSSAAEIQDFIYDCFRKDVTLHVPLSGRMRCPKKRPHDNAKHKVADVLDNGKHNWGVVPAAATSALSSL